MCKYYPARENLLSEVKLKYLNVVKAEKVG